MKRNVLEKIGTLETIAEMDGRGALYGFDGYSLYSIDSEQCTSTEADDAAAIEALEDCGIGYKWRKETNVWTEASAKRKAEKWQRITEARRDK